MSSTFGPSSSRPRPSRSCGRCARRKVKCDKARPKCSRCVQGGYECSYVSGTRHPSGQVTFIDETPVVIADYAGLQGRVNRLDDMLTDLRQERRSTSIDAVNPDKIHGLSNNLGHLYVGSQSSSRYVSPDFFAMISQEVSANVTCLPLSERFIYSMPDHGDQPPTATTATVFTRSCPLRQR